MKQGLIVMMVAALAAVGCGKKDDANMGTHDSLSKGGGMSDTAGSMSHSNMPMPGAGDSVKSGMGSMMTGNMESDMAMMSTMMVDHLGAADSMYDARFIHMMIPHHEGAVMMAEDAIAKANRPELKKLAEAIVTAQRREIDQLKGWLKSWYNQTMETLPAADMKMMGDMTSMNQMMVSKLGVQDPNYEDRFIDMMIPHHQGAVAMAQDAVGKAQHPELKALAEKIIADQEKEIGQMTEWRKQWYGH